MGLAKNKIHRKFSLDILHKKNWGKVGAKPIIFACFFKGDTKIEKIIFINSYFSILNMWF